MKVLGRILLAKAWFCLFIWEKEQEDDEKFWCSSMDTVCIPDEFCRIDLISLWALLLEGLGIFYGQDESAHIMERVQESG